MAVIVCMQRGHTSLVVHQPGGGVQNRHVGGVNGLEVGPQCLGGELWVQEKWLALLGAWQPQLLCICLPPPKGRCGNGTFTTLRGWGSQESTGRGLLQGTCFFPTFYQFFLQPPGVVRNRHVGGVNGLEVGPRCPGGRC